MGGKFPTMGRPYEDICGQDAEVAGPTLQDAGDVLRAGHPGRATADRHVDVTDVEVHQHGVVEDSHPAGAYGIPADEGVPAGMHAHRIGGGVPQCFHLPDVQSAKGLIEPLVGCFDLFYF